MRQTYIRDLCAAEIHILMLFSRLSDTRQAVQYSEYFTSKTTLESGNIYYEITYFINSKWVGTLRRPFRTRNTSEWQGYLRT